MNQQTAKELSMLYKAVDAFAEAMKDKLEQKMDEGWTGWRDMVWALGNGCRWKMINHALRLFEGDTDQAVDLANFCMFIHAATERKKP